VSGLDHAEFYREVLDSLLTGVSVVPFSILCVGMKDLKSLRARHGQGAIDTIVRVVAQSVEYCLRPTDFIGHWLESEFLTVLMECDAKEVKVIGQRVKQMVQQSRVQWWGDPLLLTVSVGYATARQSDTCDTMISRGETLASKACCRISRWECSIERSQRLSGRLFMFLIIGIVVVIGAVIGGARGEEAE
jgi:diguanylate cyclase (GGDEF)-like protein